MNFSFYIFGNPHGKHRQYPDDFTDSLFQKVVADLQGSRLAIYRSKDLTYYTYAEKINNGMSFGFCVVFNSVIISRPAIWASYCHRVVDNILAAGKILSYDDNYSIIFPNPTFSDCREEYERILSLIKDELTSSSQTYGLEAQKKSASCYAETRYVSMQQDNKELLALSEQFSTIILDDAITIQDSYLTRLIETLRVQNENATSEIESLGKEVLKRKRQAWAVGVLSLIVFAGLLIGWFAQKHHESIVAQKQEAISWREAEIKKKMAKISDLEKSISLKVAEIAKRDSALRVCDSIIRGEQKKRAETEITLKVAQSQIATLKRFYKRLDRSTQRYKNGYDRAQTVIENLDEELKWIKKNYKW